MEDIRREQLYEIIKREFIGPDPVDHPGMVQDNGEEILTSDPPRIRYAAGILFPQQLLAEAVEPDEHVEATEPEEKEDSADPDTEKDGDTFEFLEDAEELINRSNAYQQSAISITAAVSEGDMLRVNVKAGQYKTIVTKDPVTGKESSRYPRSPVFWENDGLLLTLPTPEGRIVREDINGTELRFNIIHRYRKEDYSIYTFTLENKRISTGSSVKDDDCYFQVEFGIRSGLGFRSLPDSQRINDDDDYWSNQLLYRDVRNYAIGHGCAADWDEIDRKVCSIKTSVFPSYEIKPIVPNQIPGVSLEMLKMSDLGDFDETITELRTLCDKYRIWINSLKTTSVALEEKYHRTADIHIANCEDCLERMESGVELLRSNPIARKAFQYMNRAMLLQQLHYNLPLQNWMDDQHGGICLDNPLEQLPVITDPGTWYGDKTRYGKWRPFQLAFILINLRSMVDKTGKDRKKVDLIWFPTGGGKTEAYLGLSAYTIFVRRLTSKDDSGTAILMRYTLRLLTAQQYERASAMICACDLIRREQPGVLGEARITIGLWVGGDTTPNSTQDAVKAYDKLYSGRSDINPFIMLKCPWCGAQMGVINKKNNQRETPGYRKVGGRRSQFVFQCGNSEHNCDFSVNGYGLPLYIIDDDIYENTPTLLLGTVDKFAMLPFRPQAQSLFGIHNGVKKSSPDLIIQDELHLISGPLGSMVGHYETLISELCTQRTDTGEIYPKIIASTATISRAKEQCHALYGCGTKNVVQFPPSGLDAGNSFFAVEDKTQNGRKYVGILASGSSSDTTTAIRLYASLLYGAKALDVKSEELRDPYWTNIGYFNSIRELGQAATWIRADIDEYLHVIYKRRYEDKKKGYKENRRYIWNDEELTSRIRSDKIPFSLQKLSIKYPSHEGEKRPVDICLATNMISVGVDIPRLGLMTVAGQPKTTSEYIQATSRVGRDKNAPGIVFVLYRPGRPRDKSHYEQFRAYHSRIYCNVEPTSVTPFSSPLRERALHAIMIGMFRLENDEKHYEYPRLPNESEIRRVESVVRNRVSDIDQDELEATLRHMDEIIEKWNIQQPQKFQDFSAGDALPLMFPLGSVPNEKWGKRGLPTPTSMRSVDASCEAFVLENRYWVEEE